MKSLTGILIIVIAVGTITFPVAACSSLAVYGPRGPIFAMN